MWTVTTVGDLPDESERREHETAVSAWDDYSGRILELEINGYTKGAETAAKYGREWVAELWRGQERIRVTIERAVPRYLLQVRVDQGAWETKIVAETRAEAAAAMTAVIREIERNGRPVIGVRIVAEDKASPGIF